MLKCDTILYFCKLAFICERNALTSDPPRKLYPLSMDRRFDAVLARSLLMGVPPLARDTLVQLDSPLSSGGPVYGLVVGGGGTGRARVCTILTTANRGLNGFECNVPAKRMREMEATDVPVAARNELLFQHGINFNDLPVEMAERSMRLFRETSMSPIPKARWGLRLHRIACVGNLPRPMATERDPAHGSNLRPL